MSTITENKTTENGVNKDVTDTSLSRETRLPVFTPSANIYQNEEEVVFILDMPGVDQKNVDISVEKNILSIEGKFVTEIPTGFDSVYQEFKYGNYQRKFELTRPVDLDKAVAEVKNGQLKLTIALVKPEIKKIEVR